MEWRKAFSPVLILVKVVKHKSQIPPCTLEALAPGTLTASGAGPPSTLSPLSSGQPAAALLGGSSVSALAWELGLVGRRLGWFLATCGAGSTSSWIRGSCLDLSASTSSPPRICRRLDVKTAALRGPGSSSGQRRCREVEAREEILEPASNFLHLLQPGR